MKYIKFEVKILVFTNRILCFRKALRIDLTKAVLLFVEYLIFYYIIITMEESDSYISEAINQLRSSKKQNDENAIHNLLSQELKAIAINKEQLIKRSNNLFEIKVWQNKQQNSVNSYHH